MKLDDCLPAVTGNKNIREKCKNEKEKERVSDISTRLKVTQTVGEYHPNYTTEPFKDTAQTKSDKNNNTQRFEWQTECDLKCDIVLAETEDETKDVDDMTQSLVGYSHFSLAFLFCKRLFLETELLVIKMLQKA